MNPPWKCPIKLDIIGYLPRGEYMNISFIENNIGLPLNVWRETWYKTRYIKLLIINGSEGESATAPGHFNDLYCHGCRSSRTPASLVSMTCHPLSRP